MAKMQIMVLALLSVTCSAAEAPSLLVSHGDWDFIKVWTTSTSDDGIKNACSGAGLLTPCAGNGACSYTNTVYCTLTSEVGCANPMKTSWAAVGCSSGGGCLAFNQVYTYMGGSWSRGSSCGIDGSSYCSVGFGSKSGYAFCARAATCASYSCTTSGWVKKSSVDSLLNPDESKCCEAPTTASPTTAAPTTVAPTTAAPTSLPTSLPTSATCKVPSTTGYNFAGAGGIVTKADFEPTGVTCASGYTGTVSYAVCDSAGTAYSVSGCEATCASYPCTTSGWVKQSGVDPLLNPNESKCCEATCASYSCTTSGWVKKSGVDSLLNPNVSTCCKADYECGTWNSDDCMLEHGNAQRNRSLSSFYARCATEGEADPLRSRCALCCVAAVTGTASTAPTSAPTTVAPTTQAVCWVQKDGYRVAEGHGQTNECKATLDEAKAACQASSDCRAIATQSNVCSGQYRVAHGGPTFVFVSTWATYNLRAWKLDPTCSEAGCDAACVDVKSQTDCQNANTTWRMCSKDDAWWHGQCQATCSKCASGQPPCTATPTMAPTPAPTAPTSAPTTVAPTTQASEPLCYIVECGCPSDFAQSWCTTENQNKGAWCRASRANCEACNGVYCDGATAASHEVTGNARRLRGAFPGVASVAFV